MQPQNDDNLVGRRVGRYQVERLIGSGQSTDVYEAQALDLGRQVALKVLKPQAAADSRTVNRFSQAAQTQGLLNHPSIVPLIDFGRADGVVYIANRLMSGGSLEDRIQRGDTFSISQVSTWLTALGGALDAAHQQGMIHGDLKPSHVLFNDQDSPALTDFGLASISRNATPALTVTVMGTPDYMSPEQAMGQPLTAYSDQYSLGVIIYRLLTGRMPFKGETPMALILQHVNDMPPAPHTLNPELPEALSAVILKALAKKPEDRYPSLGEFASAFAEVAFEDPVQQQESSSQPDEIPVQRTSSRNIERFTQRARRVLSLAQEEAERMKHATIHLEHILLGLCREEGGVAGRVLREINIISRMVEPLVAKLSIPPLQEGQQVDLAPSVKKCLELTVDEARRMGHHYIGTEHLLLGLARLPEMESVFKVLGTTLEDVRRATRRVLAEPTTPQSPQTTPSTSTTIKMERFTQRARRVLSLAQESAEQMNHGTIHVEHMLLGLGQEVGSVAGRVLLDLGVKETSLKALVEPLKITPLVRGENIELSASVKRSLEFAVDEARRMGNNYIGTEHLLLGLLRIEGMDRILRTLRLTSDQIKKSLQRVLAESPIPQNPTPESGKASTTQTGRFPIPTSGGSRLERFTQRARRVLALAQEEAENLGHGIISPEHLLLALHLEEGGVASRVLTDAGVDRSQARALAGSLTIAPPQAEGKSPDLSPSTRKALELAVDEARALGHHYIGTEHLLLAVMRQPEVENFLERLGFKTQDIRTTLLGVLSESPVESTGTMPAAPQPLTEVWDNPSPNPALLNTNATAENVRKSKRPPVPDQVDRELARQSKKAPSKRPQPAPTLPILKVFISYSRKDESFRRTFDPLLSEQMAELGFKADIGQDASLVAGTSQWGVTVDQTIQECDLFIFLISPDSVQSQWCQRELDIAAQYNRQILSILVNTVELSPSLAGIQYTWVEMTPDVDAERQQTNLRSALQVLLLPTEDGTEWGRFRAETEALRDASEPPPVEGDHVFLYGSSADGAQYLQRLRRDLENNGVKVWNVSQIHATGTIDEQIQQGIREAKAVIVVITPSLSAPDALNAELNLAVQLRKPIIPVQMMEAEPPLILRTYQLIDLRAPRYEVMLPRLIEAIQRSTQTPPSLQTLPDEPIPVEVQAEAPALPPATLRLITEPIYDVGAVYPVEINLIPSETEYSVVLRGKNIALIGESAFSVPPGEGGVLHLEARGIYPGGGEISAELYRAGVRVDSTALAVEVILDPETVRKPSALPLPEAAGVLARPADLTLRLQLIPLDGAGSVFRLNVVAWSGYDYLKLDGTAIGYRDLPRSLIEHVWARLQAAAENPAIRAGEVRAVGRLLWREVLPAELDKLYREQIMPHGKRRSGVRSMLIWTESLPGLPPLPFELAIPDRLPLCDLFHLTRGIEGLGGAWRTEFPLGLVHVTHDAALMKLTQTPLRWAEDGSMGLPETTLTGGLDPAHPAVGFHVIRAGGALGRHSRALTLAGDNPDAWEAYLREQGAKLSAKAPLVTLARLSDGRGGGLDDGALALEMLRSGAVAVVGTWWSVSPALDRSFWRAFYESVWEGAELGASMHAGRQAVRRIAPDSPDALAFYALGDPLATGYLVVEGIGYLEVMLIDVGQNEERRP